MEGVDAAVYVMDYTKLKTKCALARACVCASTR